MILDLPLASSASRGGYNREAANEQIYEDWKTGRRLTSVSGQHQRIIPDRDQTPEMARVVDRNIIAILQRRRDDERKKSTQDRVADRVTGFTGSMLFVYIHLVMFGAWIIINLGWTPLPKWDPSFVVLAMIASVEAIFLSTFVLISQNRMQALADKRADLDLQVSLLSEHEITQLITLVTEIARKMEIDAAHDPELRELAQDIAPEKVLDHMEHHEHRIQAGDEPA